MLPLLGFPIPRAAVAEILRAEFIGGKLISIRGEHRSVTLWRNRVVGIDMVDNERALDTFPVKSFWEYCTKFYTF